jgi:dipeptidyl aminopeptidase/acylaminoacyl peptidase
MEILKARWVRGVAVLLLLIVIVYLAIGAVLADKLSATTRHPLTSTPANYGLTYERVQFRSADGIPLAGWYIGSPGAQTILVLHGQDGERDDPSIGLMDIDRALVQHGYDVLTFDFRGYGESGGDRFSLGDLEVRDVAGALNYLKTRGVNQVGALGFSMGAATALNSAPAHPEMRAVVADSSFAEIVPIVET